MVTNQLAAAARREVIGYEDLMLRSRFPGDERIVAFAGVISQSLAAGRQPLIRGMSEGAFQRLMQTCFPGLVLSNGADAGAALRNDADAGAVLRNGADAGAASGDTDEFDDLLNLLHDYRSNPSEISDWLSCCIASATMQDQHLWQDMGLPNRALLSRLLADNFPALAAANSGDMKWKKFFYRQLCQRAGVPICKSPNCTDCSDYALCFGPEISAGPRPTCGFPIAI